MVFLSKDQIAQHVVPIFVKAMKDPIPNVRFTVAKIVKQMRQSIDPNTMNSQIAPGLKEMANDSDRDV